MLFKRVPQDSFEVFDLIIQSFEDSNRCLVGQLLPASIPDFFCSLVEVACLRLVQSGTNLRDGETAVASGEGERSRTARVSRSSRVIDSFQSCEVILPEALSQLAGMPGTSPNQFWWVRANTFTGQILAGPLVDDITDGGLTPTVGALG